MELVQCGGCGLFLEDLPCLQVRPPVYPLFGVKPEHGKRTASANKIDSVNIKAGSGHSSPEEYPGPTVLLQHVRVPTRKCWSPSHEGQAGQGLGLCLTVWIMMWIRQHGNTLQGSSRIGQPVQATPTFTRKRSKRPKEKWPVRIGFLVPHSNMESLETGSRDPLNLGKHGAISMSFIAICRSLNIPWSCALSILPRQIWSDCYPFGGSLIPRDQGGLTGCKGPSSDWFW